MGCWSGQTGCECVSSNSMRSDPLYGSVGHYCVHVFTQWSRIPLHLVPH